MRFPSILLVGATLAASGSASDQGAEFFEREVRPVLAEQCFACHSAQASSVFANLRLDTHAGLKAGSDAGPVVVPGDPDASKLMRALRGEITQMPPTGKLPEERIAAFARWIEIGAPWPDEPASAAPEPRAAFDLDERRDAHWAWQPVAKTAAPQVESDWPLDDLDRFLYRRLQQEGLTPAADASRETWIRRATFDLIGLPPTVDEIDAFLADQSDQAYERAVDRLLASPRFGEHWARRWMDLVRYAESHGSEGDPDTPYAWRYRDYLIRAFNQDLPYDQFVREQLAGDLLPEPRINDELQLNESLLGAAQWRLVEHGFQPVDPWEDRVKWTDNQVDVVSKTFLGLTVSCARCHDHKFDAVSQKDYYALFGTVKGARPTQRAVDSPERLETNGDELKTLKSEIRRALADVWLQEADGLAGRLLDDSAPGARDLDGPLRIWALLADRTDDELQAAWQAAADYVRLEETSRETFHEAKFDRRWDLSRPSDYAAWLRHGNGLPDSPSRPGAFEVAPSAAAVLSGIYDAGVYSNLVSRKRSAVLQSPRFVIDSDYLSVELQGGNFSVARLMIENYAVPRAGIYHQRASPKKDEPVWFTWKTDYWKGFTAYLEYATLEDSTNFQLDLEDSGRKPRPQPVRDGRSWFGAGRIWFHDEDVRPRPDRDPSALVLAAGTPSSREDLAARYEALLKSAITAWRDGSLSREQAWFLDVFVRRDLLPRRTNDLALQDGVLPLVRRYRKLEADIPVPRRAPGVIEEGGPPQRLLIRGGLKNLGDPVERRFLTALGGDPCNEPRLARLDFAQRVADPANPLTARVAVNRLWQAMFGRGLVRTVDNFGKMGETPSHPELLDFLAARFVEDGWSTKRTLRRLALSRAYRTSSDASAAARENDPENRLLSHMPLRRLRAEPIRDALLAVSGRLDPKMYGPSVDVYYAYAKGKTKGDQPKGPLDGDGRRSVYQEIRRNAHNPFLEVFDLPKPATTRGLRDVTNVPAQSLAMLNSPFVIGQAEVWAEALIQDDSRDASERVTAMFRKALGRRPAAKELDRTLTYVAKVADARKIPADDRMTHKDLWRDAAQAVFNLKEFLYVR